MPPRIHTVNGIWDDGTHSTDRLGRALAGRGWSWRDCNYPTAHPWTARSRDAVARRAAQLQKQVIAGDHVAAHSFGALVTLEAMRQGARFGVVVLFGAAAERDVEIPVGGCDELINVHQPRDLALMFGGLLLAHPFGAMGRLGYAGNDLRVTNVLDDTEPTLGPWRHSHYFTEPNLGVWVGRVDAALRGQA